MNNYKLPTPFLLLNKQKLVDNIKNMSAVFQGSPIALKPHFKTHKSLEIANLQIESGARGITCATLNEAEALVSKGIEDIFLAYPIYDSISLKRFENLSKKAKISCAIDSIEHLNILRQSNSQLFVRIEIDCGHHRCGVSPELSSMSPLLENIKSSINIHLDGVFTHAGHSYAAKNEDDLKKISTEESNSVILASEFLKQYGFKNKVISVGSTPTARFARNFNLINECRPGNYVFYDAMQLALGVCQINQCSLMVCSSVIGVYKDRIVIDAGSKALGLDKGAHGLQTISGHGFIMNHRNLTLSRLSEEHGIIDLPDGTKHNLSLGDKIFVIPNHSCAAANFYKEYLVDCGDGNFETWQLLGKR